MNIPFKVSQREKKFLMAGGVIVFLILTFHFVTWYRDFRASTREYIEAKQIILQKQLSKIAESKGIRKDLEVAGVELKDLEKGLLSGNKPPVAAAEVQRILKSTALSLGIEIKSERTLSPVDNGSYLGIPVEIGFTSSTAKLKDMLFAIRTSPLLLTITEMKVRVTNVSNPVDIYTTLTVKGFMKKSQIKEKG
jgi:Tfp pilus assembly protein PilO